MCCVSIVRSLYFKTSSSFFFLVHSSISWNLGVDNTHISFSSSRIKTSCFLLGMFLSVSTFWIKHKFTFMTYSYKFQYMLIQDSLSNFTPVSAHMLKHSWTHILYHRPAQPAAREHVASEISLCYSRMNLKYERVL